jgi:hypothetical protein
MTYGNAGNIKMAIPLILKVFPGNFSIHEIQKDF